MTFCEALEGKEWGSLPRASCKHKQINKYLNVCDENGSCKVCSSDVELYIERNVVNTCRHTIVVPHLPCGLIMCKEAIYCT